MPGGSGAQCAGPAGCEFPRRRSRMRKLILVGAGFLLFAPSAATAQAAANECPPGTVTGGIPNNQRASQDACQIAVDVFQVMAPQLGLALAGGNATLGRGSALGGP